MHKLTRRSARYLKFLQRRKDTVYLSTGKAKKRQRRRGASFWCTLFSCCYQVSKLCYHLLISSSIIRNGLVFLSLQSPNVVNKKDFFEQRGKSWFEKNPQLHTIALKQNVCASKYASRKKPLITIGPKPFCITKARLVICLGNQSLFSFSSHELKKSKTFGRFFRYIYTKVSK